MATDGPDPPPCNPKVFAEGTCVFVTHTIGPNALEAWVQQIARKSGQLVDWHYFGGRAKILALGNLAKVHQAIEELMPEHDRLYTEAMERFNGQQYSLPKPTLTNWKEEGF
jgi:hypothetical protein